jgi:deoxyribonuclease V
MTAEDLIREQDELARASPSPWTPSAELAIGGCFFCSAKGKAGPGAMGDPAWAGAAVVRAARVEASAVLAGQAGAPYEPGLLALREGPLLEAAVASLGERLDVLLVDATGRDHPRRAGLALQLGAVLDVPTVGVTHRPLVAEGEWPRDERGARSPLRIGDEIVGHWLRTKAGTRPLAVHAAWRTGPEVAVEVVLASVGAQRTPAPLREARRLARTARAGSFLSHS